MPETSSKELPKLSPAKVIYALYGAGFFLPFLALAGLVYAYIAKGENTTLDSHLRFQITTFWLGMLMLVVGSASSVFFVGYAVLLFWLAWTLCRLITGYDLAHHGKPVAQVGMLGCLAKAAPPS